MTEQSFQDCRKLMQKANYLRGVITTWEGNVAKWTRIEGSHRENLRHSQADGAAKMIEKSMAKLKEVRAKFAALKFPESDLKKVVNRCGECGCLIGEGNSYCGECLCED